MKTSLTPSPPISTNGPRASRAAPLNSAPQLDRTKPGPEGKWMVKLKDPQRLRQGHVKKQIPASGDVTTPHQTWTGTK